MDHVLAIRLGSYFGIFAVMASLELIAPRRPLTASKGLRWLSNVSVTFLNSALVRLLFPVSALGVAVLAREGEWGILNALSVPGPAAGVISVVLLDLLVYGQHVAFHLFRPLWRLHMMHHADLDIDVTTGARFHPVEILASMCLKMAAIAALGAPAWSVVAFEVILNGTAMFNHSNVRLPLALDRVVRTLVVTPDMHRVHHSVIIREMNSNYGFNLSVWDRLFGTYRPQPVKGHEGMRIGLANYRDLKRTTLPSMLALPLTRRLH